MGILDSFKKKRVEENLKKGIREVLGTPVSDIMSKYVISIQSRESLRDAAQIIVGEKVSCVVVKDDERPIGVVTERDFLKKAPVDGTKLDSQKVTTIMSPKLVTIHEDQTVAEAVPILVKNNFRKLVVEKDGQMIGIVTQTDFVRLFDKFYSELEVKTSDMLKVSEVMTKKVETIKKGGAFTKAKQTMATKDIGSIIVTEGKKIGGIITEYDVAAEMVDEGNRCVHCKVEETMVSPVMTIDEDITIFEANRIMVTDNVRRLPVAKGDDLLGIVTQTDLCRSIFYFLKTTLLHLGKGQLKWEPLEKREVTTRLV